MRINLLFALLLSTASFHISLLPPVTAAPVEPSYAKWGRLAMEATKERYPRADIIDYQHIGRSTISTDVSQEAFKLWLREGHREWGVLVTIQFESRSNKFLTIHFKET